MKSVMTWIKANLTIVILLAVTVLVLPAAFVGSYMWNKKIRVAREAAASKAMTDLGALKLSYVLPSAFPGGTAVTLPMDVPNAGVSAFFKEHRDELEKQIAQVGDVAKRINSEGHEPLVAGLFPEATDKLKIFQMIDLLIGKDEKPSVYQMLLNRINAGGPADPVRIADLLEEEQARFTDAVKAKSNRDKLTAEEQQELDKKLVALRIGQYQNRAREISVYATADCLPRQVPVAAPAQAPDPATCWEWQFDYWTVQDLVRGVDAANTDSSGRRLTLDKATVKRIESIELPSSLAAIDPSITGRKNSAENKLYDVRHATMKLIVASARLPELIDAFSRTNFMTIIGLDVDRVDPWSDLDRGYYYGTDHVVRATIEIETVWLRSWTEAFMPQPVKDAISGTVAGGEAATAAPAAPATPRGRGAADEGAAPSRGKSRPAGPRGGRGGDGGL